IQPFIEAGIKLNNDAIVRIPLGIGFNSQDNNFSEVQIVANPPPPPPPPEPPKTAPLDVILPLQPKPPSPVPAAVNLAATPMFQPILPQPIVKLEDAPQGGDGDYAW